MIFVLLTTAWPCYLPTSLIAKFLYLATESDEDNAQSFIRPVLPSQPTASTLGPVFGLSVEFVFVPSLANSSSPVTSQSQHSASAAQWPHQGLQLPHSHAHALALTITAHPEQPTHRIPPFYPYTRHLHTHYTLWYAWSKAQTKSTNKSCRKKAADDQQVSTTRLCECKT